MDALLLLWQDIQWQQPEWFWLLLALPLLMLWQIRYPTGQDDANALVKRGQIRVRHSFFEQMTAEQSAQKINIEQGRSAQTVRRLPLWLQGLRMGLLASLLVVLAQPQIALPPEPKPQQKTVRDVLFVVESSASFLLDDYQVNGQNQSRMEAVKSVLDSFIAGLPGNRFAITVYAQEAFNLMPLSSDQAGARLYLQRLRPYLAGRTDEGISEALGLALQQTQTAQSLALQSAQDAQEQMKRVLILISDGDNLPPRLPIDSALAYAKLLGVPIYTVGVGAQDKAADKRQFTGLIYQALKSDTLQWIAQETGGRYFEVGNSAQLNQVLQEIDQLEGVPFADAEQKLRWQALYPQVLLGSFVLWLFYVGLLWRTVHRHEEAA